LPNCKVPEKYGYSHFLLADWPDASCNTVLTTGKRKEEFLADWEIYLTAGSD
jgi:hypothetical protein